MIRPILAILGICALVILGLAGWLYATTGSLAAAILTLVFELPVTAFAVGITKKNST